ncbi:MBL fold metallo-hydrolase [Clostridium botulinum]|uniref:ComEC/Rec2 family competence protein n=1 Tax=unclassified Clostridium TaxID=2614128 RepID=UPI00050460B6|nr:MULTISPECIES: ComEC/Rec2 family competence protein [unclassified Clostridium]AIY79304.1 metallo-beta-lactamase superfamily protein [Clostridium botulinum 202F]KAI3346781.1 MBL fold metallo-hydrolase [Clostridium botulinum]KFX54856.1 competence protein [Clostridium botulinum]MBY6777466.1 MBL fold metallo-hydrolase [Clostridium botulinum]MBY6802627.1 MBL fold metallo-hydrolase [Clostridium botulinum]
MRVKRNLKFNLLLLFIIFAILFMIRYLNLNVNYYDCNNNIIVHYIDVGQGDAALIQVNNINMLIDSGPKESRNKILDYLQSLNIKKINYIVATHPHEDHIGNMAKIIKTYGLYKFYAPKIENTTSTFEKMIDALKDKNLKINVIKKDTNPIDLGKNTDVTIFSPIKDSYDNINNYSPVIKIQYGDTSFLFTGDAEKEVENEILLDSNNNIRSDVIKIGHHGSSTSSSKSFIEKVNPSIAIISVGADNKFNHPNKSTIDCLTKNNVKIYQTNKENTIILSSDGHNIIKK